VPRAAIEFSVVTRSAHSELLSFIQHHNVRLRQYWGILPRSQFLRIPTLVCGQKEATEPYVLWEVGFEPLYPLIARH